MQGVNTQPRQLTRDRELPAFHRCDVCRARMIQDGPLLSCVACFETRYFTPVQPHENE